MLCSADAGRAANHAPLHRNGQRDLPAASDRHVWLFDRAAVLAAADSTCICLAQCKKRGALHVYTPCYAAVILVHASNQNSDSMSPMVHNGRLSIACQAEYSHSSPRGNGCKADTGAERCDAIG